MLLPGSHWLTPLPCTSLGLEGAGASPGEGLIAVLMSTWDNAFIDVYRCPSVCQSPPLIEANHTVFLVIDSTTARLRKKYWSIGIWPNWRQPKDSANIDSFIELSNPALEPPSLPTKDIDQSIPARVSRPPQYLGGDRGLSTGTWPELIIAPPGGWHTRLVLFQCSLTVTKTDPPARLESPKIHSYSKVHSILYWGSSIASMTIPRGIAHLIAACSS